MDIFISKLFLSFLVGGSFIAFTIWLSEKFGSKIGGLIIGLPSTTLISLLFIAITQNDAAAIAAAPIMPAVFASGTLFVTSFVMLQKRGLAVALICSLALFFALDLPLVYFHLDNIWISLIIAAVYYYISINALKSVPHRKLPRIRLSKSEFAFRSGFAGSVIALAVFLGKTLGPLWGGLFGAFPAAFSSSLVIISRRHGPEFTASVARSMPYGSMGTAAFLVAFYFFVPVLGLWVGTALALAVSLVAGYLLYKFFM